MHDLQERHCKTLWSVNLGAAQGDCECKAWKQWLLSQMTNRLRGFGIRSLT